MATYNLTQNIDSLTGGTGNDVFNAPLFTTQIGTLASSLQTGDRVDGGAGNDVLNATLLADGSASVTNFTARPILTNIEALVIESLSNNSGDGDAGQGKSTVDLLKSSGITSFTSSDSNNQLNVTNAGAIGSYTVMNSDADDYEDGLIVTGITATALAVKAINVSADGLNTETLSFTTKSGAALSSLALAMNDAQINLNAAAAALKLTSNGPALNTVHFMGDGTHSTVMATGAAALYMSSDTPFTVATSFDASAMTGTLTVDQAITGTFATFKGSQGNDLFDGIASSGGVQIDMGAGNDVLPAILATGVANSVQMGAGNDLLDVSATAINLTTDTLNHFDGGAGTDTLRAHIVNGFTIAQAAQLKNFELLDLTSGSAGSFDLAATPGVTQIVVESATGQLYFQNAPNNATFTIEGSGFYHIDPGTHDTASNIEKFVIGDSATVANSGPSGQGTTAYPDIFLNESGNHAIETVNVISHGGALSPLVDAPAGNFAGVYHNVNADFNAVRFDYQGGTTTLNISGNEDLQLLTTSTTTSSLTTVNASPLTAALDITASYNSGETYFGLQVAAAGATITGGHGNDFLAGGAGADVFNLGAGGKDQIDFILQSDSNFASGQADTINNFTSGDDKLAFNGAHGGSAVFQGSANVTGVLDLSSASVASYTDGTITLDLVGIGSSFSTVQAGIASFHGLDSEDYGAAFDTSTSTLYIDSNHDGALTAADMAINLPGIVGGGVAASDLLIA